METNFDNDPTNSAEEHETVDEVLADISRIILDQDYAQ